MLASFSVHHLSRRRLARFLSGRQDGPVLAWARATLSTTSSTSDETTATESSTSTTDEDIKTPESSAKPTNPALISLLKNPIVQQLWAARQEAKDKKNSTGSSLNAGGELAGKAPFESRVEVSYPFSSDQLLLETYKNPWGQMRFGKMMEDIDALAGNIAFLHVHDTEQLIVTASVDRIRLRQRPHVETDQHLSGQVTWTGRSSMEIRMLCHDDSNDREWLEAFVTFVTLDPVTKKAVPIPPLLPQNAEERALFDAGGARASLRKKRRQQSSGSNDQVDRLAQSLLQQAAPLISMPSLADPHSILMSQTALQNALVAQPQVRNLHNRIFGGYLVRRAFELAFANAYLFGGQRPVFLEVDEVSFTKPVDVGDLLVFNSRVVYTEDTGDNKSLVHIQVEAWVTEPEQISSTRANQFYFTYSVPTKVRKVLPSNIDEARLSAMRILADEEQGSR
jgi:acyl-coenzyme A thioesterase 9